METSKILSNEIIAEVHTDRLWWRLKKQTYDNKPPHYCIYKDRSWFCPIETSNSDLSMIIEAIEKEVSGWTIDDNLTDEWKELVWLLIEDWKEFLSKLKSL